jgi:hypothetical protein
MNNEPAFPSQAHDATGSPCQEHQYGMTIRDFVAALQLAGASANPNYQGTVTHDMIVAAFDFADRFLIERAKSTP